MPFHLRSPDVRLSRRDFLAGLALGGATLALAEPAAGDEEGPWFALVSDTHIPADRGQKAFGQVPAENLRIVVADILSRPRRPEGVLINGDLALKDGKPGDYAAFLTLLEPLRRAGVPIHLTLGNHDDRGHFRQAIRGLIPADSAVEEKHAGAFEVLGRRFLLLDSLDKVDKVPGRLGEAQLAWLAHELDAHKDVPTVVFVHHPPHSGTRWKRHDALLDGDALLDVVEPRPWVESLVFGHTHRWSQTTEYGLELVNLTGRRVLVPARAAARILPARPRGRPAQVRAAGRRPQDGRRRQGPDRRPRHHHAARV